MISRAAGQMVLDQFQLSGLRGLPDISPSRGEPGVL
jgi:hypothetical protein